MGREKLYQPRVEFFVASLTVNICRKTRGEGDGSASGCGAPDLGMLVAGSEAPQRDSARCRSPLGLSKTLVGCRLRKFEGTWARAPAISSRCGGRRASISARHMPIGGIKPLQRPPIDVLHGDESQSAGLIDFVNRDDVRVVQRRSRPGFLHKPRLRFGIGCGSLRHHLNRYQTVQAMVAGFIHRAHPSLAQLFQDLEMGNPGPARKSCRSVSSIPAPAMLTPLYGHRCEVGILNPD